MSSAQKKHSQHCRSAASLPAIPDPGPAAPIVTSKGGRVLIDIYETARRVGRHHLTLYRWKESNPDFPRPIRVSPGRIAYYADEVEAYINNRPRT
ncbi:AlpA family phage regulatory protein [Bradyrhizobium sp. Arg62]|uniref:helix-turn-helix transcriptional regulator n=1 Tax=Bradyrhizobium brasilense TaxID=1419277 RepID=UPI001E3BFF62|nr:hypothetical protein [Bradyrhizobium brasilense]MCC8950693.1 AlpA family phage regulatory protein [Bradyrhizobium brasilense]